MVGILHLTLERERERVGWAVGKEQNRAHKKKIRPENGYLPLEVTSGSSQSLLLPCSTHHNNKNHFFNTLPFTTSSQVLFLSLPEEEEEDMKIKGSLVDVDTQWWALVLLGSPLLGTY